VGFGSKACRKLARKRRCCRLEAGAFVEALLAQAGCAPGDRESEYYVKSCRPLEYEVLCAVAWDLVAAGVPVVLDAPFGPELASAQWWSMFAEQTAARGGQAVAVAVRTPPELLRRRIEERGAVRDRGKLENWDTFVNSLPVVHSDIPVVPLENSGSGMTWVLLFALSHTVFQAVADP
jgi:predicted kinase